MAEITKSVIGSVRLDSDVWDAVRAMPVSLNVYLRDTLLGKLATVEELGRIAKRVAPRKVKTPKVEREVVGRPFKGTLPKPSEKKR